VKLLTRLVSIVALKGRPEPTGPTAVYVPQAVARETARLISSYGTGRKRHEGIAYWAGVATGSAWVITTVLAPEAVTTAGSYKTTAPDNAQVVGEVNRLRLQILAQIHGHPGDWVDHSLGDDEGAFMPYEGFYSLVLPRYGCQGMLPLSKCGVHRYQGCRFVRLTSEEIEERFVIVPTSADLRRRR